MAENEGILVHCETAGGTLVAISKEMLGGGGKLARALGEDLLAVFVGSDVAAGANEAARLGAAKVFVFSGPDLEEYNPDRHLPAVASLVSKLKPRVVLMGHTSIGQDLMPRLAFELGSEAVLDCVDLSIDPDSGNLLRTKPVYGGKALATFVGESWPQLATVRAKSMPPAQLAESPAGEVILLKPDVSPSSPRIQLQGKVLEEKRGIQLEDAEVIISGGRGIGGPEGFQQLYELAALLPGATVGASRNAVDAGWVPSSIQVGLTGKVVAPRVYIATALSGASQHMAGCSGADTIVAINTDKKAHIFKEATFGVVGDWKVVLPAFVKTIHEM